MPEQHAEPVEELGRFIESTLVRALALDSSVEIGSQAPARLGLNSLGAIALQYQLQSAFGLELMISEILGADSVDALTALGASRLRDAIGSDALPPLPHDGVLI